MELKKESTLAERIKALRLSLQKPYYFFSAMENGDIYLLFENEKGEQTSFREKSMIGCVAKAEDFLQAAKIRAGQQKKLEEQPQEAKLETKESPSIEVETVIRDPDGKEHKDLD